MSYASSAIKRLSNEYRHIQKVQNRVSDYFVAPLEENIFEWHFTLRGPAGDDKSLPYKDGLYHGALIFSRSYPLEPPDIMFFTRSGRFATHEKICSTISSYHKELWQPTYDVALTLSALRHFMAQEDEFGVGAFPKNMVAAETKLAWAKETWSFKCATCGRGTQEVWETEMKMYPETSPEKEALVPKLPPAASAASSAAAAVTAAETSPELAGDTTGTKEDGKAATAEESAAAAAAASPAAPTPAPSADDARFQSGEKEKSEVEEAMPDISANAATVSLPAQGPLEPKDAGAAGGLAAETTGPRSPRSPTLPPAAPARRRKVEDTSFEPNDSAGHDFPEEECERYTEGVEHTLPYLWQHSEGARDSQPEYSYEVDDDDYDEDGVPRRCFLTSLPLLNDEEARQLEMADTSTGIPNMRFEPVLQAAIRREAREKAAAAAAAAGLPPQPSPPASPSPEMLYAELAEVLAQGFANEVDAGDSAAAPVNVEEQQPQPTPPQQQLAENAVFGIHTYRVSIPLRYIDRAIIWSFSLIVLILARRAGWAMLSALWSAS